MAQVMEAVAFGLGGFERRVAIKRLLPQHARDGERRRMFFEEARIGSQLHHGGIVPIFDYGLIDGSEFLAMEYVDGLDALRAVSGPSDGIEPMPEGIALHVAAEIAHALAYIHDLRDEDNRPLAIVHRDVSPPNILLSWNGDVKLSDFGIALARVKAPAPDQPAALGGVQGKLHYMAPEQARGEPVCASADVYALGATLDALLGGGALRPVSSDESGNAREVAAQQRGLSLPVCALIHSCMTRDPRFRPTAADVAARAGVLASRLLGTDGRGALRAWLEPVRARMQQAGALDDLMGLCLVPIERDGARAFTISRIWEGTPSRTRARARRCRQLVATAGGERGGGDDRGGGRCARNGHSPPPRQQARARGDRDHERAGSGAARRICGAGAAGSSGPRGHSVRRSANRGPRRRQARLAARRRHDACGRARRRGRSVRRLRPARADATRRTARDRRHLCIGTCAGPQIPSNF